MKKLIKYLLLLTFTACGSVSEQPSNQTEKVEPVEVVETKKEEGNQIVSSASSEALKLACMEQLGFLPEPLTNEKTFSYCENMLHKKTCTSALGAPIFHYDKESAKDRHIKVLVLATIHGDEGASGTLAWDWVERLRDLDPRSQWRILPVLNPDGLAKKTRTNANGVDLNRNFPTEDWFDKAQEFWRERGARARRFPGNAGGSEPETRCIVDHIEDFSPDFIISIHTPYGVLDFDGPDVVKPKSILPWRRLGHMPGSLGRFMWKDKKVPVLTIELDGPDVLKKKQMEDLQDIIGTVAIRSLKKLGRW